MNRPFEAHERMIIQWQLLNPAEEVCGILKLSNDQFEAIQLENIAQDKATQFSFDASGQMDAKMIWHTHPGPHDPDTFSDADKWTGAAMNLPMCLYVARTNRFHYWKPDGYRASILNRPWCPVIFDCFALVRDALFEYLDVTVIDFDRPSVNYAKGVPAADNYWAKAGFSIVHQGGVGRVALMHWHNAPYVNHIGWQVNDSYLLHQVRGHTAQVEYYSSDLRRMTAFWLQHPLIDQAIIDKNWEFPMHELADTTQQITGVIAPPVAAPVDNALKAAAQYARNRQKQLRR